MASKRKFTLAPLSDEEENKGGDLGGVNAFKKYKQTEAQNGEGGENENSQKQVINAPEANNTQLKASEDPEQGNSSNPKAAPLATNQVGKNFRETFAYLKKTDLFVLPPMPEKKQATAPKNSNSIIVNSKQRGNPILKHIRNIPWEYGEIVPDYEIGRTSCSLFLSMRYHSLNPDYIHERLKKLGNMYDLRILLVLVDVVNSKPSLKELGRVAMYSNCTLILSWSPEEAGRYLETFKSYEHKPPDILQQRVESDHLSKMQDLLTTVKSINKTDVITLMSTFGSLRNIVNATKQELSDCPGFGSQKATRLYNAFNEPFKRAHSSSQHKENIETPKVPTQTKIIESNTVLPSDCQLKKPEPSQPDVGSKSKKCKKKTTGKTGEKNTDNEYQLNSGSGGIELQAKGNETTSKSTLKGIEEPDFSMCEQSGNRNQPGSSKNIKKSLEGQLSKSEAIQQFMKQKNSGETKESMGSKNQKCKQNKTKTTNSKQTTSTITQRLRNDLKERVKKVTTSPITNTNSFPSGKQSTKELKSTQLTEEEFNDLVAESDDGESEGGE